VTHKHPTLDGLLSQLIGSLGCAASLAYLQWLANRDSMTEPETPTLIKYLLLDIGCFLFALFVIRLLFTSDANRFLSYLILAVTGSIASSLLIDIRWVLNHWGYREIAEGHAQHLTAAVIYICVLNSVVSAFIMSLVFSIAFMVRSIHRRITKAQLRVTNGGI
jgi:hypothetical protein